MSTQPPSANPAVTAPAEPNPFRYLVTEGFSELLAALGCTLAATTYQAGKLVLFRADRGRISALFRTFDSAMGLAVAPDRLAVGARHAVWLLRNAPDVGRQLEPRGKHDACFIPRAAHITGDIRIHEMAWCVPYSPGGAEAPMMPDIAGVIADAVVRAAVIPEPELWIVNTRFSCLCTLDSKYSFVPRWRPPFVSALVPEDRCHLNGLAVVDGRPAYVTALGMTDTIEGWRPGKARGGILIDIASGNVVSGGLAMPHSPRVHRGKLFVLDSGEGALEVVDQKSGQRQTVARLPGYTRGLALVDKYAFVGLSRIREKREFGGLPIEQGLERLKCGIACVDWERGQIVGLIEFETGCEEIFDVQLLPTVRYPAVIGLHKDTINGVFVMPNGIQ